MGKIKYESIVTGKWYKQNVNNHCNVTNVHTIITSTKEASQCFLAERIMNWEASIYYVKHCLEPAVFVIKIITCES